MPTKSKDKGKKRKKFLAHKMMDMVGKNAPELAEAMKNPPKPRVRSKRSEGPSTQRRTK